VAYCVHCGDELLAGAAFCRGCGEPTGATASIERGVYAGFWRRLAGSLIDSLVLLVPFGILAGIGAAHGYNLGYHYHPHAAPGQSLITEPTARQQLVIQLIVAVPSWLYFALFMSSGWQATLGQRAVGVRVTDLEGRRISFARATGRYFASIVSDWTLGIGYLMMIWTKRKQTLQDMMASTVGVKHRD
jgi:uncharacterized RDD family membrane protein YckC